ncbi:MAG: hypothetical protein A2X94_08945 [Bdellovibrionales bacterium GWB1_55_8]|nr:MAG: hypothetical protein A2X94_08945 [Bdellovibrionales bacterium GWB1_55_8]
MGNRGNLARANIAAFSLLVLLTSCREITILQSDIAAPGAPDTIAPGEPDATPPDTETTTPAPKHSVYLDFDDFPVTTGSVPGNAPGWLYSSRATNDYGITESASSGWRSSTTLPDGIHWFFDFNRNNVCYDHMFGDTYGYMDITASGHTGNALRNVITGGRAISSVSGACPNPPSGTQLYNKESFTDPSQIFTGAKIGTSYIYFKRITAIGGSRVTRPFDVVAGANRMSVYVQLPGETSNGTGGYGVPPHQTYQAGVFRDGNSTGYHHYMNFYTQGGGWTKIQIEETTNGDNGGNGATRHIPGLLESVWQFYFTTLPQSGMATPPWEIKLDNFVFEEDPYAPQNNETISNIALLFKDASKTFEISFNDKYKNKAESHATFELRYSSIPITNENWSNATPAHILADSRFSIQARTDGKFQKATSYYQGVWAPFSLSPEDTEDLTPGQTVYFAIKDISQVGVNSQVPMDGINGTWGVRKGGRPYDTLPSAFDYAKDQPALPYIKRISYTLSTN